MPPTPEQLQININQQLIPQATQVAPTIIDPNLTATVTKESEVSMPEPRDWIGSVDYGMNWYALGAKAFDVAANIYERVLDYNIQKKGAEVADAIYDSETQVYDSFNATQLDESGNEVPNDINSVTKFYEDKQTQLRTKINEIIGNDIFDPNFSFDGYGSKWFPVIDGARRGYSELARAGQRVQRDTLVAAKEQQDIFTALDLYGKGYQLTSKQATAVDNTSIEQRQKLISATTRTIPASSENIARFANDKTTIIDKENGTLTIQSSFADLPPIEKQRVHAQYDDVFGPKAGQSITASTSKALHELATSDFSAMNPNELAWNLISISSLPPAQFNAMVTSGQDLTPQQQNKLRFIRTLAFSGMPDSKIVSFVKNTPPDVADKVANLASYFSNRSPSTNLPYYNDAVALEANIFTGISPEFKLTNDHETVQAMSSRYPSVHDYILTVAYISNLPIEQVEKDKSINLIKEQFNASHAMIKSGEIETLIDIRNIPVLSASLSGPLDRMIKESMPVGYSGMGTMKTQDKIIMYAAAQLATVTYNGNTEALVNNREKSFDSTYNTTHVIVNNRIENIIKSEFLKLRSQTKDKETGKQVTGGLTDSLILQHVLASSDQALANFNGGKTPVTEAEILTAYNKGMASIGPAHSWKWDVDTTTDSEVSRIKQDGTSSVPMRLKSIPIRTNDMSNGSTGFSNLLDNTTIFPPDNKDRLIKNSGGKPTYALTSNKTVYGMIDITGQQEDLAEFVASTKSGKAPVTFRSGDIDQFGLDHYVDQLKTKEQIVYEVSNNLIREVRNTNLDTAFLGSDPKLDSREKFKMAIYKDQPFLIRNAAIKLGISNIQATNIVHELLTDEKYLDTIYNRNVDDTYLHALADTTITIAQFQTNNSILPSLKIPEAQAPTFTTEILNQPNQQITNIPIPPAPVVSTPVETLDQKKERFKKEGMTDADIERMLKFKSVNPDAVSPGAVRGSTVGDFITEHEGLKTTAYYDEDGKVWTIGKGTTKYEDGKPVKQGDKITKEKANQLMESYIENKVIPTLEKTIPTWSELDRNQRDALVSFAYNVGPNFYGKEGFETITKELSSVDTLERVSAALKLYNKSKGKVLDGLTKRRKAEGDLWNAVVR